MRAGDPVGVLVAAFRDGGDVAACIGVDRAGVAALHHFHPVIGRVRRAEIDDQHADAARRRSRMAGGALRGPRTHRVVHRFRVSLRIPYYTHVKGPPEKKTRMLNRRSFLASFGSALALLASWRPAWTQATHTANVTFVLFNDFYLMAEQPFPEEQQFKDDDIPF